MAPITSTKPDSRMPTHVRVNVEGLVSGSVALLEQISTIDKRRLDDYVGKLNKDMMGKVDHAIITSLGIMLMYGKVSQENYVELTAASAIPNKEIKSPQILRY